MKTFPFRILFVGIFLPPICYILTLQLLEGYFQRSETAGLNRVMIRNHEALYGGRYSVKEEVNRNLREYLSESHARQSFGMHLDKGPSQSRRSRGAGNGCRSTGHRYSPRAAKVKNI